MKLIYLSILALSLVGCSTTTDFTSGIRVSGEAPREDIREESTWDMMLGKWHGKQPRDDGGIHEWLVDRQNDGRYTIIFRSTDPHGRVTRKIESGLWGVSGNIYFLIFEGWIQDGVFVPTDMNGQFTRDAYEIISLTETMMKYRSIEGGSAYTIRRVSDAFEI